MDRQTAVRNLLLQAEIAHSDYEQSILNGAYDREWPHWYAEWLIRHDFNDHIATPLTVAELSTWLAELYGHYQQSKQSQHWSQFYAEHIPEWKLSR